MDQGPVDAGPSNDSEYDIPSPIARERSKRAELPVSTDGKTVGDEIYNATVEPRSVLSVASDDIPKDPPLYARVGATAEELAGNSEYEASDHLKAEAPLGPSDGASSQKRVHRMHKFTLYETNARYWIIGADISDKYYKLLRVDRTPSPGQISMFEDEVIYNRHELNEVLTTIDEGNRATGGLRVKTSFWGLLGFIRFTDAYYMVIITKRGQVAMLGGHYIYQVEGTELVPLTTGSSSRFTRDRNSEEVRFLAVLANLDLTKHFYFSYTYDITRTLQHNIIAQRTALNEGQTVSDHDFNGMFVWNHHLLKPASSSLRYPYEWCLPIIHGFIDQAVIDVFGRCVYVTIIGRRSRFFAGARFLKRGINDMGHVANDVETEQIVSEMLTTSFHAPGPRLFSNPTWTSYVHHRGSIPLYWTQDNSGVNPKPDIDLNLPDPFYQPAALHFDNLFDRYGCPVYVLNLIKSRERTPRESKLLVAFQDCVDYLNQSLPTDKQIVYKAFDMSRASKTRGGDVIGNLEIIAKNVVDRTGFFHNGDADLNGCRVQNGVARTNCIDCLDRTNAAQFVIGKRAFGVQLQALGVLNDDVVKYDTDAVNIFTHMFHDHGDTIAVQYGGSHLVNTMATYRKLNQWQSHSRDMVESFKRYYHNSFLDNQRQEAYNLFLGNYIWAHGQPMLWDLVTDYYLHHSDPRNWLNRPRRDYYQWYTPNNLRLRLLPPLKSEVRFRKQPEDISRHDDYWLEYYRPSALSSFLKIYSFRMNSTTRYLADRPHGKEIKNYDFSPFKPRFDPNRPSMESPEKKPARKGVKIVDPSDEALHENRPYQDSHPIRRPLGNGVEKPSILSYNTVSFTDMNAVKPADKAQMHLWTLNQFHTQSLNPYVSDSEAAEYARYLEHPLNLSLVTSLENPSNAHMDLIDYVQRGSGVAELSSALEQEGADCLDALPEQDLQHFSDFLEEREDPLTVTEEDGSKKRYKAYRQWLRGKSLFKQSKVDPEYRAGL